MVRDVRRQRRADPIARRLIIVLLGFSTGIATAATLTGGEAIAATTVVR